MAVVIYPIRTAPPKSFRTKNDIGDQVAADKASENRDRIDALWRLAVKVGMAYRSDTGEPVTSPIAVGAICYDPTYDDFYVCTDRSTPTWAKLTE